MKDTISYLGQTIDQYKIYRNQINYSQLNYKIVQAKAVTKLSFLLFQNYCCSRTSPELGAGHGNIHSSSVNTNHHLWQPQVDRQGWRWIELWMSIGYTVQGTHEESKNYLHHTHFPFLFPAYAMKLVLPRPDALPTDASLECFWGDGETLSAEVLQYTQ